MREFQLWDADSGLSLAFEQIESTARSCGFRNCTHQGEPRCAIAAELESGRLDRRRYENYLKLQRELEHQATKADPVATRRQRDQRRKRGRRQRKMMKNRTKW